MDASGRNTKQISPSASNPSASVHPLACQPSVRFTRASLTCSAVRRRGSATALATSLMARLEALKAATIQRWINRATADKQSEKIVLAHTVLRSAMAWAMTQRVMTFNPAALVRVRRPVHRRASPLSPDQARKLLEFAGDHRLGGMFVLSLTTGLRNRRGVRPGVGRRRPHAGRSARSTAGSGPREGHHHPSALKTASSRRTLSLPATSDIYGHLVPEMTGGAAARMDQLLKAKA